MSARAIALTHDSESGRVELDGASCFVGDVAAVLGEVDRLVDAGRPSLVVTPNVDQVLTAEGDQAFREIMRQADLRLVDGMPLILLARALGSRDLQRHTGADLLPILSRHAHTRGWRVAIAGGKPRVAAEAARRLNLSIGSDVVHAVSFPRLSDAKDEKSLDVLSSLNVLAPEIVFLCLGAPKQEEWFSVWREHLPPAVFIGAGAAVDFAAGEVRRAPRLIQKMSLEWAWRLVKEPRRLGYRYLIKGPRFASVVWRSLSLHQRAASTTTESA